LLPATLSCVIDSILLTDHATVRLQMTPYQETERSQIWRFNSSLLHDVGFKEDLRAQIRLYLETNVPTAPSAIVAWEAMKAFLRGYIIQYSSYKKKVATTNLIELERRIKNIEAKLKINISEAILKELTHLKYEYNTILSKKTEYFLFRARQTIFESGDKAGKFLARHIKQKEVKLPIAAVTTGDGSLATKSREINDIFKKFYINLYTSENTTTDKEIASFLNK